MLNIRTELHGERKKLSKRNKQCFSVPEFLASLWKVLEHSTASRARKFFSAPEATLSCSKKVLSDLNPWSAEVMALGSTRYLWNPPRQMTAHMYSCTLINTVKARM